MGGVVRVFRIGPGKSSAGKWLAGRGVYLVRLLSGPTKRNQKSPNSVVKALSTFDSASLHMVLLQTLL